MYCLSINHAWYSFAAGEFGWLLLFWAQVKATKNICRQWKQIMYFTVEVWVNVQKIQQKWWPLKGVPTFTNRLLKTKVALSCDYNRTKMFLSTQALPPRLNSPSHGSVFTSWRKMTKESNSKWTEFKSDQNNNTLTPPGGEQWKHHCIHIFVSFVLHFTSKLDFLLKPQHV